MKNRKLQLGSAAFFALSLLGVALPRCDTPEELCNSAADIYAQTMVRCGTSNTFDEVVALFKNQVAFGNCKTIKSIRDQDALLNECLPWLEKASCDLVLSGRLLPACKTQFSTKAK